MAYYLRGPPSSSSQEGLRWSTVAEHSVCYRGSSRAPLGCLGRGLRWPTLPPGGIPYSEADCISSQPFASPQPHASRTASPGPESSHARRVPGGGVAVGAPTVHDEVMEADGREPP